jgi:GNAT superfamily N-acetyltransferase
MEQDDVRKPTAISIRPVRREDVAVLRDLYEAAARVIGPQAYGPAQVRAWASFAREEGMVDFILRPQTFVAQFDGRIVGFAGLCDDGLVNSLFVHPDVARRGIGTRLLRHLIDQAGMRQITRLWTHASHFSRGTFQKQGFEVVEVEYAERGGVVFKRFLMERKGGR